MAGAKVTFAKLIKRGSDAAQLMIQCPPVTYNKHFTHLAKAVRSHRTKTIYSAHN